MFSTSLNYIITIKIFTNKTIYIMIAESKTTTYKIKIEEPEDSDDSFTMINNETINDSTGIDLEQLNLECDIRYEHLITNDGSNIETNKQKLNTEFRKFINKTSNIYDLHKLYRKCNKLSFVYECRKNKLMELIIKFNNNEPIDVFKNLEKTFIFKHNQDDFLPTYVKIIQKNYPFINTCYKIYVTRKLALKDRIIKLGEGKITSKNIYTLKCNLDIDKTLNN